MGKIRTYSESDRTRLLTWFRDNRRPLPWRLNRDPYRVWLSETMLQQTTTTAVIPYFERFLKHFPTLQDLAAAPETEILRQWAGLGYYSRARNLHRAAQQLVKRGEFPKSATELIELPGFGPYTARAVSSIAFGEAVGVLDGNVIRVLSRYHRWSAEWWRPAVRAEMQTLVDSWVKDQPSNEVNQALMELGATTCTPTSPSCALCPLRSGCGALHSHSQAKLPVKKPKRPREIWLWTLQVEIRNQKMALQINTNLPFLRGHLLPPGKAVKLTKKPKQFAFRHSVTHHDIFVNLKPFSSAKEKALRWVKLKDLAAHAPASIIKKAIGHYERS